MEDRDIRLGRVREQLRLYEHPLFEFVARGKGEGVEVLIQAKAKTPASRGGTSDQSAASVRSNENDDEGCGFPVHTYVFEFHPRDLDHPQFEWQFQRQLYDALHDYLIEMFVRTPQDRAERRERGQ